MFKSVYKIIELLIDEDEEAMLESISLVDRPAIERDFMYFSKEKPKYYFEDNEQRIVVGPVMVPEMRIPRNDGGEIYYVYFTKETIAKAAELFLKHDRASKQNTDHKDNFTKDIYLMESWLIEDEYDKAYRKYGFEDLPIGTWMTKMRVMDDKVWNEVKEGKYKGFSVQGDFLLGQEKYEKAFAAYKRKYKNVRNKWKKLYKGLSQEEKVQLDQILFLVELNENDYYETADLAIKRSKELGLNGEIHSHYDEELDILIYMPGKSHEDYEEAIERKEITEEMNWETGSLPEYTKPGATADAVRKPISQLGFVSVNPGESKDDYIGRCMSSLQGEFPDQDQRYAVCITEWQGSAQEFESYTDYPEGASNNARRAIEWKEKNGSDCGTQVGWTRARQLANREPISEETIARMASFERHRQNSDTPYSEGCGGIMWDAWGGDSGIRWAQNKLKEIRGEEFRTYNYTERRIISDFLRDIMMQYNIRFAAVEDLKVGDEVSWKTADQNPRGRIREIVREGSKKVPGRDFEVTGTPDNPGYIIEIYTEDAEGNWKPSGEFVGRKADSILKNVDL
jgi:tetratricopeptide (TPR) repeat protein